MFNWDFQEVVGRWGAQTFPKATNQSIIEHMYREMTELIAAEDQDGLAEECADIYLMLLHLAHKNKFDLFLTAEHKHTHVNSKRTWGAPDALGVSEHIKQEQPEPPFRAVMRHHGT